MNYQHLLTFSRNSYRRKLINDFRPDVFVINQSKWNNYSYGMPVRIIELLVKIIQIKMILFMILLWDQERQLRLALILIDNG